jgi:N12 class adenine-specific DNA methylase
MTLDEMLLDETLLDEMLWDKTGMIRNKWLDANATDRLYCLHVKAGLNQSTFMCTAFIVLAGG